MSFEVTCYFILTKKKIDSSTYGDISGPFSKTEINSMGLPLPLSDSIIIDITTKSHVIGLPKINMNMISKNRIFFYMATYNIGALLSIKPYISIAGNDTGEGAHEVCIDPANRKKLALLHNSNRTNPLTSNEKTAILSRGNIHPYRHCIFRI
mgnify:CR=1 FL=1